MPGVGNGRVRKPRHHVGDLLPRLSLAGHRKPLPEIHALFVALVAVGRQRRGRREPHACDLSRDVAHVEPAEPVGPVAEPARLVTR